MTKNNECVEEPKKTKGWLKAHREKLARAFDDLTQRSMDQVTLKARAEQLPRWAAICGVTEYTDIDYSNPVVSLEFQLCDPEVLRGLQNPTRRAEFLSQLTEDERRIYYEGFWMPSYEGEVRTEPIIPYSALENPEINKGTAKKAIKMMPGLIKRM